MRADAVRKRTERWVILTGSTYLVLTAVWIILTLLTAPEGTVDQQLAFLSRNSTLYRLSFVTASLISVPLVVLLVLVALFRDVKPGQDLPGVLGAFFLAPYLMSVSTAYVSQYTLFPRFLADMSIVGRSLVKSWYYNNPDSIPYMLDLLGLVFFALSALAIGSRLLGKRGWSRGMGWLLLLSGMTALLGFGGYVLDNLLVESAAVVSGFLTVPFCVLAVLQAARQLRSGGGSAFTS